MARGKEGQGSMEGEGQCNCETISKYELLEAKRKVIADQQPHYCASSPPLPQPPSPLAFHAPVEHLTPQPTRQVQSKGWLRRRMND